MTALGQVHCAFAALAQTASRWRTPPTGSSIECRPSTGTASCSSGKSGNVARSARVAARSGDTLAQARKNTLLEKPKQRTRHRMRQQRRRRGGRIAQGNRVAARSESFVTLRRRWLSSLEPGQHRQNVELRQHPRRHLQKAGWLPTEGSIHGGDRDAVARTGWRKALRREQLTATALSMPSASSRGRGTGGSRPERPAAAGVAPRARAKKKKKNTHTHTHTHKKKKKKKKGGGEWRTGIAGTRHRDDAGRIGKQRLAQNQAWSRAPMPPWIAGTGTP